jgi:3-oxoacyl-[acyl-carrier-protein] synthase-3
MALLEINGIRISGISACVPKTVFENKDYSHLGDDDLAKFIKTTGIERRRISSKEVCTSDLCYEAADKLINDLGWDRNEIDVLVFVTQTPDYILPATSTILQDRLKLSDECIAYDISLGCSGYIYGMSTITSMMAASGLKKGLLLVGDTITKVTNKKDKSTDPLFGDAGTATAFERSTDAGSSISFHLASDGSGHSAIHINHGGFRNPFGEDSLVEHAIEEGITRRHTELYLDGMDVFSFGIDKAPSSVRKLMANINKEVTDVDYFIFHQANRFMNEKIRKKLAIPEEKHLYSLKDFGNTSSATIPLTIIYNLKERLRTEKLSFIMCGFGVGLSWGTSYLSLDNIICPDLIEI